MDNIEHVSADPDPMLSMNMEDARKGVAKRIRRAMAETQILIGVAGTDHSTDIEPKSFGRLARDLRGAYEDLTLLGRYVEELAKSTTRGA